MAIECCYFRNNTSLIPDELLAHRYVLCNTTSLHITSHRITTYRLGLVPLKFNPSLFDFLPGHPTAETLTEQTCVVLELKIACTVNKHATAPDGSDKYINGIGARSSVNIVC